MIKAINLLCDTVKVTLGPKGNNVIIDHSNLSPFITNDGVTIAENIESEDEVINTILELAKESSIKTNDIVGDGTTTTLVLLQSIYNEGIKLIKEGINPIILKKELDVTLNNIIEKIMQKSRKPNNKDLLNIATISSNDDEIGSLISKAFIKAKNKDAINIIETEKDNCYIEYQKGYTFETELASPYFFNNEKEISLENTKILLIEDNLTNTENIDKVLNEVYKNKLKLIIFANDYDEYLINQIISFNIDNNLNIFLFKTPNYGIKQKSILKDISVISGAKITKENNVSLNNLGHIDKININKEVTNITFKNNENIIKRINEIKENLNNITKDYDKDFYNKRLAMFSTCISNVYVGSNTITERREKKMRFDDALCAIDISTKGIVPGFGITLLEISKNLEIKSNADKIMNFALETPTMQILYNSGLDKNILDSIKNSNYKKLYNIKTEIFEDINDTTVIDPALVLINSLKNATSIASMLLTTSHLVINEYKNNNFHEL